MVNSDSIPSNESSEKLKTSSVVNSNQVQLETIENDTTKATSPRHLIETQCSNQEEDSNKYTATTAEMVSKDEKVQETHQETAKNDEINENQPVKSQKNITENNIENQSSFEIQIETLETEKKSSETKITPSKTKKFNLESKTTPLESKVKPLESKINPLETRIATETKIDSSETKITSLETKSTPLESEIKPSEIKISHLESKTKPSETRIDLETKIGSLENKITPSETKLTPSETKVTPSDTRLKPSESKLELLESKNEVSESQITPLEGKSNTSETQISPLEILGLSVTKATPSETRISPSETQITPSEPLETKIEPSKTKNEPSESDIKPEITLTPSLQCSVPLNKVKNILNKNCIIENMLLEKKEPDKIDQIQTENPITNQNQKSVRRLLCLFCDRTFISQNLRQKHMDRCHSGGISRRFSSRTPGVSQNASACWYCSKLNKTNHTLKDLLEHLVKDHSNRYFACLQCEERYGTLPKLREHNKIVHNVEIKNSLTEVKVEISDDENRIESSPQSSRSSSRIRKITNNKNNKNDPEISLKTEISSDSDTDSTEIKKSVNKTRKRLSVKSAKSGVKSTSRTTRLQTKLQKKRKNKPKTSEITQNDDEINEKQVSKSKKSVYNSSSVFSLVNLFTYKYEKIYDHASDGVKDASSGKFDAVFDKEFYQKTVSNIKENLLNHLDGKLNRNVQSETRISNFEQSTNETNLKTQNSSENFGCDVTLNAATPVASLGGNWSSYETLDDQIEYASKATKKASGKRDKNVKYKFPNGKFPYRSKTESDLTSLDMWTQFRIKERQRLAQSRQENLSLLQRSARAQREELNCILDKRGPFEDLRVEALEDSMKNDGNDSVNPHRDVNIILEEILSNVFQTVDETEWCAELKIPIREREGSVDLEIPSYLNLQKCSNKNEVIVDLTDKATMTCIAQDSENQNVELTGEWARPRIYICATCALKLPNLKSLQEHKNNAHPNVWSTHYEFVGKQSKYYKHLAIPSLGKVGILEQTPVNKLWVRSNARTCSKCTKTCHNLGELHRHILECGGDWQWMLARKKCKYRPYGAKRRRQRGYKRTVNPDIPRVRREPRPKQVQVGPRPRPSDAETIQRMLANLPAKRNRKMISMRDSIQGPRKPYRRNSLRSISTLHNSENISRVNSQSQRTLRNRISQVTNEALKNSLKRKINARVLRKRNAQLKLQEQEEDENSAEEEAEIEIERPIGTRRRLATRTFNRVLGSKILDNNSTLISRRQLGKSVLQNNLRTRLRTRFISKNKPQVTDNRSRSRKKLDDSPKPAEIAEKEKSDDSKVDEVQIEPENKSEKPKKSVGKRLLSLVTSKNKKLKTEENSKEIGKSEIKKSEGQGKSKGLKKLEDLKKSEELEKSEELKKLDELDKSGAPGKSRSLKKLEVLEKSDDLENSEELQDTKNSNVKLKKSELELEKSTDFKKSRNLKKLDEPEKSGESGKSRGLKKSDKLEKSEESGKSKNLKKSRGFKRFGELRKSKNLKKSDKLVENSEESTKSADLKKLNSIMEPKNSGKVEKSEIENSDEHEKSGALKKSQNLNELQKTEDLKKTPDLIEKSGNLEKSEDLKNTEGLEKSKPKKRGLLKKSVSRRAGAKKIGALQKSEEDLKKSDNHKNSGDIGEIGKNNSENLGNDSKKLETPSEKTPTQPQRKKLKTEKSQNTKNISKKSESSSEFDTISAIIDSVATNSIDTYDPTRLSNFIRKKATNLVKNLKKTTERNPGKNEKSVASKIIRTLSMRKKLRKVQKSNSKTENETDTCPNSKNDQGTPISKNVTSTLVAENVYSVDKMAEIGEKIGKEPITETENLDGNIKTTVDLETMPTLEKIDTIPPKELVEQSIPTLTPIYDQSETQKTLPENSNLVRKISFEATTESQTSKNDTKTSESENYPSKIQDEPSSKSDLERSEIDSEANLKGSKDPDDDFSKMGTLSKLKNKFKRSGKGLNDCIAMLRNKLEKTEPAEKNLVVLNCENRGPILCENVASIENSEKDQKRGSKVSDSEENLSGPGVNSDLGPKKSVSGSLNSVGTLGSDIGVDKTVMGLGSERSENSSLGSGNSVHGSDKSVGHKNSVSDRENSAKGSKNSVSELENSAKGSKNSVSGPKTSVPTLLFSVLEPKISVSESTLNTNTILNLQTLLESQNSVLEPKISAPNLNSESNTKSVSNLKNSAIHLNSVLDPKISVLPKNSVADSDSDLTESVQSQKGSVTNLSESVPNPLGNILNSLGSVLNPSGSVPNPSGSVIKLLESVSNLLGSVPNQPGVPNISNVPNPLASVLSLLGNVENLPGSVPNSTGNVSNLGSVPNLSANVQNTLRNVSNTSRSAPKPSGSVPTLSGIVQNPSRSVSNPIGSVPTPSGSVSNSGSVPSLSGSVQNPSRSVSNPIGSVPTPSGSVPNSGSVPTLSGSVPTHSGSVPTPSGSVPTLSGSVPNSGSVPTPSGSVPTLSGSVPNSVSVPTLSGSVPTLSGSVPNSGTVPTLSGSVPNPSGSVPNPSGSVSNPSGSVPNSSGSVPNTSGSVCESKTVLEIPNFSKNVLPSEIRVASPEIYPDLSDRIQLTTVLDVAMKNSLLDCVKSKCEELKNVNTSEIRNQNRNSVSRGNRKLGSIRKRKEKLQNLSNDHLINEHFQSLNNAFILNESRNSKIIDNVPSSSLLNPVLNIENSHNKNRKRNIKVVEPKIPEINLQQLIEETIKLESIIARNQTSQNANNHLIPLNNPFISTEILSRIIEAQKMLMETKKDHTTPKSFPLVPLGPSEELTVAELLRTSAVPGLSSERTFHFTDKSVDSFGIAKSAVNHSECKDLSEKVESKVAGKSVESKDLSGKTAGSKDLSGKTAKSKDLSGISAEFKGLSGKSPESKDAGKFAESIDLSGKSAESKGLSGKSAESKDAGKFAESIGLSGKSAESKGSSGRSAESESESLSGKSAESKYLSGRSAESESESLSGKSAESKYLSGKSAESKGLSGKSAESEGLSGKSAESKYLPGKSVESKVLSGKSTESDGLSGKSAESKYLSGKSVESKVLSGKSAESEGLSGKYAETDDLSGKSAESEGLSGKSAKSKGLPKKSLGLPLKESTDLSGKPSESKGFSTKPSKSSYLSGQPHGLQLEDEPCDLINKTLEAESSTGELSTSVLSEGGNKPSRRGSRKGKGRGRRGKSTRGQKCVPDSLEADALGDKLEGGVGKNEESSEKSEKLTRNSEETPELSQESTGKSEESTGLSKDILRPEKVPGIPQESSVETQVNSNDIREKSPESDEEIPLVKLLERKKSKKELQSEHIEETIESVVRNDDSAGQNVAEETRDQTNLDTSEDLKVKDIDGSKEVPKRQATGLPKTLPSSDKPDKSEAPAEMSLNISTDAEKSQSESIALIKPPVKGSRKGKGRRRGTKMLQNAENEVATAEKDSIGLLGTDKTLNLEVPELPEEKSQLEIQSVESEVSQEEPKNSEKEVTKGRQKPGRKSRTKPIMESASDTLTSETDQETTLNVTEESIETPVLEKGRKKPGRKSRQKSEPVEKLLDSAEPTDNLENTTKMDDTTEKSDKSNEVSDGLSGKSAESESLSGKAAESKYLSAKSIETPQIPETSFDNNLPVDLTPLETSSPKPVETSEVEKPVKKKRTRITLEKLMIQQNIMEQNYEKSAANIPKDVPHPEVGTKDTPNEANLSKKMAENSEKPDEDSAGSPKRKPGRKSRNRISEINLELDSAENLSSDGEKVLITEPNPEKETIPESSSLDVPTKKKPGRKPRGKITSGSLEATISAENIPTEDRLEVPSLEPETVSTIEEKIGSHVKDLPEENQMLENLKPSVEEVPILADMPLTEEISYPEKSEALSLEEKLDERPSSEVVKSRKKPGRKPWAKALTEPEGSGSSVENEDSTSTEILLETISPDEILAKVPSEEPSKTAKESTIVQEIFPEPISGYPIEPMEEISVRTSKGRRKPGRKSKAKTSEPEIEEPIAVERIPESSADQTSTNQEVSENLLNLELLDSSSQKGRRKPGRKTKPDIVPVSETGTESEIFETPSEEPDTSKIVENSTPLEETLFVTPKKKPGRKPGSKNMELLNLGYAGFIEDLNAENRSESRKRTSRTKVKTADESPSSEVEIDSTLEITGTIENLDGKRKSSRRKTAKESFGSEMDPIEPQIEKEVSNLEVLPEILLEKSTFEETSPLESQEKPEVVLDEKEGFPDVPETSQTEEIVKICSLEVEEKVAESQSVQPKGRKKPGRKPRGRKGLKTTVETSLDDLEGSEMEGNISAEPELSLDITTSSLDDDLSTAENVERFQTPKDLELEPDSEIKVPDVAPSAEKINKKPVRKPRSKILKESSLIDPKPAESFQDEEKMVPLEQSEEHSLEALSEISDISAAPITEPSEILTPSQKSRKKPSGRKGKSKIPTELPTDLEIPSLLVESSEISKDLDHSLEGPESSTETQFVLEPPEKNLSKFDNPKPKRKPRAKIVVNSAAEIETPLLEELAENLVPFETPSDEDVTTPLEVLERGRRKPGRKSRTKPKSNEELEMPSIENLGSIEVPIEESPIPADTSENARKKPGKKSRTKTNKEVSSSELELDSFVEAATENLIEDVSIGEASSQDEEKLSETTPRGRRKPGRKSRAKPSSEELPITMAIPAENLPIENLEDLSLPTPSELPGELPIEITKDLESLQADLDLSAIENDATFIITPEKPKILRRKKGRGRRPYKKLPIEGSSGTENDDSSVTESDITESSFDDIEFKKPKKQIRRKRIVQKIIEDFDTTENEDSAFENSDVSPEKSATQENLAEIPKEDSDLSFYKKYRIDNLLPSNLESESKVENSMGVFDFDDFSENEIAPLKNLVPKILSSDSLELEGPEEPLGPVKTPDLPVNTEKEDVKTPQNRRRFKGRRGKKKPTPYPKQKLQILDGSENFEEIDMPSEPNLEPLTPQGEPEIQAIEAKKQTPDLVGTPNKRNKQNLLDPEREDLSSDSEDTPLSERTGKLDTTSSETFKIRTPKRGKKKFPEEKPAEETPSELATPNLIDLPEESELINPSPRKHNRRKSKVLEPIQNEISTFQEEVDEDLNKPIEELLQNLEKDIKVIEEKINRSPRKGHKKLKIHLKTPKIIANSYDFKPQEDLRKMENETQIFRSVFQKGPSLEVPEMVQEPENGSRKNGDTRLPTLETKNPEILSEIPDFEIEKEDLDLDKSKRRSRKKCSDVQELNLELIENDAILPNENLVNQILECSEKISDSRRQKRLEPEILDEIISSDTTEFNLNISLEDSIHETIENVIKRSEKWDQTPKRNNPEVDLESKIPQNKTDLPNPPISIKIRKRRPKDGLETYDLSESVEIPNQITEAAEIPIPQMGMEPIESSSKRRQNQNQRHAKKEIFDDITSESSDIFDDSNIIEKINNLADSLHESLEKLEDKSKRNKKGSNGKNGDLSESQTEDLSKKNRNQNRRAKVVSPVKIIITNLAETPIAKEVQNQNLSDSEKQIENEITTADQEIDKELNILNQCDQEKKFLSPVATKKGNRKPKRGRKVFKKEVIESLLPISEIKVTETPLDLIPIEIDEIPKTPSISMNNSDSEDEIPLSFLKTTNDEILETPILDRDIIDNDALNDIADLINEKEISSKIDETILDISYDIIDEKNDKLLDESIKNLAEINSSIEEVLSISQQKDLELPKTPTISLEKETEEAQPKPNDSDFITTPDLNTSLVLKIQKKLNCRLKKPKRGRRKGFKPVPKSLEVKKTGQEEENHCEICNKSFTRIENLIKHKRTLTHISKLSEIEAKENAEKQKLQEQNAELEDLENTDGKDTVDIENLIDEKVVKLVDIISDVLDKPAAELNLSEPVLTKDILPEIQSKRYKSMAERKSFDSDTYMSLPQKEVENEGFNVETNNQILSKQLSLLENMIEKTNPDLNYIEDSLLYPPNNFEEAPLKPAKFSHSTDILSNFIKPTETSDKKSADDKNTRKILNRDEELFLECCSLLKSGSEISNPKKPKLNQWETQNENQKQNYIPRESSWLAQNSRIETPLGEPYVNNDWSNSNSGVSAEWNLLQKGAKDKNTFDSTECTITQKADRPPLDFHNAFSETQKPKEIQNLLVEKLPEEENLPESNTNIPSKDLDTPPIPPEEVDENLKRHVVSAFGGLMAKALKCRMKAVVRRSHKAKEKRTFISTLQPVITDFATVKKVPEISNELLNKNSADGPKKIVTKGAMKVFEGIKVSIPMQDLDLAEVLKKKGLPKADNKSVDCLKGSRNSFGNIGEKLRFGDTLEQASELPGKDSKFAEKASKFPEKASKFLENTSDFPERASKFPERALKFPERSLKFPEKTSKFPETTKHSEKASELPERASKFPERASKFPERASKFPENTSKFPERASKFPERASKFPEKGSNKKASKFQENTSNFSEKASEFPEKFPETAPKFVGKSSKLPERASIFPENILNLPDRASKFTEKPSKFPIKASEVPQTSDIYDFHESADNFQKLPSSETPIPEISNLLDENSSEEESEAHFYDSNSFEENSLSSDSLPRSEKELKEPSEKSLSKKDSQKKCMIMGRIFKNASKPKLEDKIPEIRDISSEENSKIIETYLDSYNSLDNFEALQSEIIIPEKPVTIIANKNKMSTKEMDFLFDKLLNDCSKKDPEVEIDPTPQPLQEKDSDSRPKSPNLLEGKTKKKSKKRQRRNSEDSTTTDEFVLPGKPAKTSSKKRKNQRKIKKQNGGINLEQEIKECIGVAGRKSQRKCTSGKQNVLTEFWSSDESVDYAELIRQHEATTRNESAGKVNDSENDIHGTGNDFHGTEDLSQDALNETHGTDKTQGAPNKTQDALNKIHGTGNKTHGTDNKIHGTGNKIHGISNKTHGTDKFHGTSNQIHGTGNKVHGTSNKIHGTDNKIHGTSNKVHGTDKIYGTSNQIHGTDNKIHGTSNKVHGTSNKVHGTSNKIHGTSNKVHGTSNKVHGTSNKVHGTSNKVHGTNKTHGTPNKIHGTTTKIHSTGNKTQNAPHKSQSAEGQDQTEKTDLYEFLPDLDEAEEPILPLKHPNKEEKISKDENLVEEILGESPGEKHGYHMLNETVLPTELDEKSLKEPKIGTKTTKVPPQKVAEMPTEGICTKSKLPTNSKDTDSKKVTKRRGRKKRTNSYTESQSNQPNEKNQNLTNPTSVSRRKRNAAETLYYWSSTSDEEPDNLIEVKPIRDQPLEDERPMQHGWIVGDSPKKLVTMLAQAKGHHKKVVNDSGSYVKDQNLNPNNKKSRTTL